MLRGIACPTEQCSFGHMFATPYPWLSGTSLDHETVLCGSGLTYDCQPTSSITDGSATITLLGNTLPGVMQGYAINPNQLHYAPGYDLSGSGSGLSAPGLAFSQPFMHVPTPNQYSRECKQDEMGATTLGQDDSTTQSENGILRPHRLSCDWPGSRCKLTFKRRYELDRHKRTQHERRQSYPCPALGCNRQGSKAFYRNDKLKHHVRIVHTDDDSFACPVKGCQFYLPPDLLALHLWNHGTTNICKTAFSVISWLWQLEELNREGRRRRICPLRDCLEVLSEPASLARHLLRHNQQMRLHESSSILNAGFSVVTLGIICPVCKLETASHLDFIHHVEASHLITDIVHFKAWEKYFSELGGVYPLSDIPACASWWIRVTETTRLACPSCNFKRDLARPGLHEISHHFDLLVPPESLRPYRRAILKLWPEFEQHEIFEDVLRH